MQWRRYRQLAPPAFELSWLSRTKKARPVMAEARRMRTRARSIGHTEAPWWPEKAAGEGGLTALPPQDFIHARSAERRQRASSPRHPDDLPGKDDVRIVDLGIGAQQCSDCRAAMSGDPGQRIAVPDHDRRTATCWNVDRRSRDRNSWGCKIRNSETKADGEAVTMPVDVSVSMPMSMTPQIPVHAPMLPCMFTAVLHLL